YLAGHAAALDELLRLHGFVDKDIANAGRPPQVGHDALVGIGDDALRQAVASYREHVRRAARTLTFETSAEGAGAAGADAVSALRVQVALTLADLSSGLWARDETADVLKLTGPVKALFVRAGTIVDAASGEGGASDARVADVVHVWEEFPAATRGVELLRV